MKPFFSFNISFLSLCECPLGIFHLAKKTITTKAAMKIVLVANNYMLLILCQILFQAQMESLALLSFHSWTEAMSLLSKDGKS